MLYLFGVLKTVKHLLHLGRIVNLLATSLGGSGGARNTAISIAIVVDYATPNPRVFSFSVVPNELIATTIDEKINGTNHVN